MIQYRDMNKNSYFLYVVAFFALPVSIFAQTIPIVPATSTVTQTAVIVPEKTDIANNPPAAANSSACVVHGPQDTRAMWIWDPSVVTDNTDDYAKRETMFAFADTHHITDLSVSSYKILTSNDDAQKSQFADFIAEADKHCMSVTLLAGDPSWYLSKNVFSVINFVNQAVNFSASLSDPKAVKALELDVEPYSYKNGHDWNDLTKRPGIAKDLLSMYSTVKVALGDSGIALNIDMPYWYDTAQGITSITRFGATKSLADQIIDTADQVTILDYSDTAFGVNPDGSIINAKEQSTNGLYDLASEEISYADASGKTVVVGVETKCFDDASLASLTFCGARTLGTDADQKPIVLSKGAAYMEGELAKIKDAFSADVSFGGFAIHHYVSYEALPESY